MSISFDLPTGSVKEELTTEKTNQVESILRVLLDSIQKLKISLLLPRFFESPLALRRALGQPKYAHLVVMIEKYLKDKERHDSVPPHLDMELLSIIDIFHQNCDIVDHLTNWMDDLNEEDKMLLESFNLLYLITQQRLRKSALTELAKEKNIHKIYNENEVIMKQITAFKSKLKSQKLTLRWKLAAKDAVIKKYEEDLAHKKWENSMRIQEEIVASSRRIRNIHNASVIKQKELEEELEKTRTSYEKVLKNNLKNEKEVREEKNKLLLQLQAVIKKYDTNIGDKIKENMQLQEAYREQKKEFDEFMIEYQREEDNYIRIIVAKEEEEKRIHEEKIMLFMMNRAARIIQKAWRRFRKDRKKKSKKGKGGKGKKK